MDRKTHITQPHDIGIHFTHSHEGIIDQNKKAMDGTFLIMRFDKAYYTVDTAESFIKEHRPFQHTIEGSYNPYGQGLTVWVRVWDDGYSYYMYALPAYT